MAESPPNFHKMDSRSACIQGVLRVKVKVKGHVIRALSWILGMSYSIIDALVIIYYHHPTAQCTLVQNAVLGSHVVRLSVRPSVTLVDCDHIGWKSWKLIAWAISPTPSLFAAERRPTYSQGNMGKFWGD